MIKAVLKLIYSMSWRHIPMALGVVTKMAMTTTFGLRGSEENCWFC